MCSFARGIRWALVALPCLAACSKTKPGTPTARGTAPVSGATRDAGGVEAGAAPAAPPVAGAPGDLLNSLRPEYRSKIAGFIGVGDVSELTLYEIDLAIDPDAGTFLARETIDFHNRTSETLSTVVLRVYGNMLGKQGEPAPVTPGAAQVGGSPAELRTLGPTTYEVTLPAPLPPAQRVRIALQVDGRIPRQEAGQTSMMRQAMDALKDVFGFGGGGIQGYGILSMGDGIVSLAAWYPAVARYYPDEKRWDAQEPSGIGDVGMEELANYRVTVRAPAGSVIASSGVRLDAGGPGSAPVYGGAALRDFTVLVSPSYVTERRQAGETTITAYVPAGREEFAKRIVDYAAAALEVYERRFGPYTLTELDVAAAPLLGGAGGVEFPGIVTVATMTMQDLSEMLGPLAALLPAGGAGRPPILDEMVEFVVVHETAHQWWNALVGSDSVRHPFIDEGMAQYSSILYFEDRYGADKARTVGDRNVKANYLVYRLLGSPDGVVDRSTGEFSGMLEYAALVYGKGPYFYAAVRQAIGDDAFAALARRYYADFRYKVAEAGSFTRLAGELSGRPDDLLALHRRWLEEAHGDEDVGTVTFGQLVTMLVGDAQDLGPLAGLFGGAGGADGGTGDAGAWTAILQQMMGGAGADGGTGGLDQILGLLGQMAGGADAGADGGGVDLRQLAATAQQILSAMGSDDPNVAKLIDLLGRIARGEEVSLEELLPLMQFLMQMLGSLQGGADGGGDPGNLMQLMQMMMGQQPAPTP